MNPIRQETIMAGYLCALGATAIWSGNFIVARGLSDAISPVSLAFWRWVVAVLVFLPFAVRYLKREQSVIRENIGYLSLTALLGVTTFNTLIYIAGHTTTAMNLSLIAITFPVFIILLMRFLYKEPIQKNTVAGIFMVSAGVILLITDGKLETLRNMSFAVGDLWMLLAAIIFAIYSILVKNRPLGMSIMAFQSSTFILGLFFLMPFYLWQLLDSPYSRFDSATMGSILYLGIGASLISFILWNKAIELIGPTKTGLIYYSLPVFSGILAILLLGEQLTTLALISSLLIPAGVITANKKNN